MVTTMWNVDLPAEEVPPERLEPALGINFARDGMERKDWLSLAAVHSDAWLYAVAFYHGARFDKNDRMELFKMMNELPTVFDVVTGRKPVREKTNNSAAKSKSSGKVDDEQYEKKDDEHGETLCGSCGESYTADEFWIGCDICDKWFRGKCVKITAAKAEHIKQYKCPSCSNKRAHV